MDTPQLTPALLDAGLEAVADGDSAFGAALDGGYWGIGLRTPGPGRLRRRADEQRRAPARSSAPGSPRSACTRTSSRRCCDVDTFADARAVAARRRTRASPPQLAALELDRVAA